MILGTVMEKFTINPTDDDETKAYKIWFNGLSDTEQLLYYASKLGYDGPEVPVWKGGKEDVLLMWSAKDLMKIGQMVEELRRSH